MPDNGCFLVCGGEKNYESFYSQSENDDTVLQQFSVPVSPLNTKSPRSSEFIVFTMTRRTITWNLVGFPDLRNWNFSGPLDVYNSTTSFVDSRNNIMSGTGGTFTYSGIPGHTYVFTFSGSVFFTANHVYEKYSDESGGYSWTVPVN